MRSIHPSPSSTPLLIGAKLRSTRQAQGLTIEQIADSTGLTKGFISRVERDETSPSVATLITICQVLSLPVGSLFEPPTHEVIPLADAPTINMGGTGASERLITPRGESHVQVLRSTLQPGASGGSDLYTINGETEVLHVLTGQILLHFRHGNVSLRAGDTITFSGKEPHSWSNLNDTVAEVIWTIAPAAWSGSA
ncbi:helix-turn-helix domain-containing protein [Lysinibacter sp. HNR]|uniref:helix-turn-helix domain-containing protein n=1 Tax=Lysinibacter sp. HNR TaxID=3031408 RepID=UPI0024351F72|nr:helix-turn-helix domain-containing protein [Lysinibacter sp. HNR]WGD37662.1 helix-turn-helix domain-containing protein [Lysinibacter sp. HNR]